MGAIWNHLEPFGAILSKKSNFGSKALRKVFSTPNMGQKCGNSPYSVHQGIRNLILPHFDPKMSFLGPLEAEIIPK